MAEILFCNPDPDPCMALREQDHGVEARSFKRRGKKERGIKTGGQAFAGDTTRPSDLLPLSLEGRRWLGIIECEAGNSGPDRTGKHVGTAGITRLVAVHRTVVSITLQQTRSFLQDARDSRIVRRDEGSEDLRHVAYAAPLIAGEQLNPALLDNRLKS